MKTFIRMEDGCRLLVNIHGPKTTHPHPSLPPVLFIHPPLLTSANFCKQVTRLRKHFNLITVDLRGHGESDPSDLPLTYEQIIADFEEILNRMGVERCCLFGYSTGGGVALHALTRSPQRFVGAIVVSGMAVVDDWKLWFRFRTAIALSKRGRTDWLRVAVCAGNADTFPIFWRLWRDSRGGCPINIRQYYESGLTADLLRDVAHIHQPVMVLGGERDTDFYRYAVQLQARLARCETHFLLGHKHRLPTFAAAEVNRLAAGWMTRQFGGRPSFNHSLN
jgi:pimeloyl-ACP methyl ester carboxylesterase